MKLKEKENAIDYFCDEIIADMDSVSAKSTKADMIAHMSHWRVLLTNIKDINKN